MRKIVLTAVVVALITGAVVWAQTGTGSTVEEQTRGEPSWARLVSVVNWPVVQTVDGTVNVGNLPPVQDVSGSVEVTNLPAVQQVTGAVEIMNLPGSSGPPQFAFVGITTAKFDGSGNGGGWLAMTGACAADYPGSRMAFSDEVMASVNPPVPPDWGWINPRIATILRCRERLARALGAAAETAAAGGLGSGIG